MLTLQWRIGAALVAVIIGASGGPAPAQFSSEPVELVYRDGQRRTVRAAPFLGIFGAEVRLGGGGNVARAALRFLCFRACPDPLPDAGGEDMVIWADGSRTTGAVWVGGEYDGDVVRQTGRQPVPRHDARVIRFADTP